MLITRGHQCAVLWLRRRIRVGTPMGYDAVNTFQASPQAVVAFLELLGFEKLAGRDVADPTRVATLRWWSDDHYRHYHGLWATVTTDGADIIVYTRANAFRTLADAEVHNSTIKNLMARFGGSFRSDYGRQRYFPTEGYPDRGFASGGCFLAMDNFLRSVKHARYYLHTVTYSPTFPQLPPGMEWLAAGVDPAVLSNSLLVPFLVASFEEFCRQIFVALFRYSNSRERVLKNAKIVADDLVSAMDGTRDLVEVTVRWFNFQSLPKIASNFQQLEPRLDILAALKRPYRRRKKTLYQALDELISRRHRVIHNNEVDGTYRIEDVRRDLDDLAAAATRIYEALFEYFGWECEIPIV